MALSWSAKRQFVIIVGLVILGMIFIGIHLYPQLNVAPSCTDGKQNGTEHGVDCGGPCARVCPFEANSLQVVWSRVFPSLSQQVTAVAYIDNKNTDAGVMDIPYEFKIFDTEGRITTRNGHTFVGTHGTSAIVESRIFVGNRIPTRATFDFLGQPAWIKFNKTVADSVTTNISVDSSDITDATTATPKLAGTIHNNSFYDLENLDVIAIVYNAIGEAIGVSSNHLIDPIVKNSSQDIFFTWANPFIESAQKVEIIPRINPFVLR
jgi:hypothetical protein